MTTLVYVIKMNTPTVSVIIPVFNRPDQAIEAILSVLLQDFSDFEVIVVDDGSEPALNLLDKFVDEGRVVLIRLDQNKGPSAARNVGAKAARGNWLAWLDSDDQWHRDKLARQMAYLQEIGENAEHIALACGFGYVDEAGNLDERISIAAFDPLLFFSGCWFCPGSTVILSRSLFERVGPYDETLHRLEDLDWFARMALAGGRLEVVPENCATISTGQKASYTKVKEASGILLAKYKKDEYELPPGALANLRAYLHLEQAASALKRDRRRLLGIGHLVASWRYRPRTSMHIYDFWR